MLREAESDLRRGRFDGDAVPADAAAAHFMAAIARGDHERPRGLARDVPGEGGDEDQRDDERGEDDYAAAAEAPARRQAVGLNGRNDQQVESGQIPHYRVGNRHGRRSFWSMRACW